MIVVVVHISHSACAGVVIPLLVLLLYIGRRHLVGIVVFFFIPAFGENLRQWNARVSASPPLSSTHYGPQRPASAKGKSGQLR